MKRLRATSCSDCEERRLNASMSALREFERALAQALGIAGVLEAALAPIEHVDDDRYVALTRQLGEDAASAVVLAAKGGKRGVLEVVRKDLFLSPEIEAAVVVQEHHAGRGELRVLGDGENCRDIHAGRGLQAKVLYRELGPLGSPERFGVRLEGRGRVKQAIQNPRTSGLLPLGQGTEFRPKERERDRRRVRQLLNERIQAAEVRLVGCGPAAGASVCAAAGSAQPAPTIPEVKNLRFKIGGCIADQRISNGQLLRLSLALTRVILCCE